MSIQSEINRINSNVQSALNAVADTGVSVPENANSNDLPAAVLALANEKQDKLTFDAAPTANSTNPVTSGGVKTELDKKASATSLGAHTGNTDNPHQVTAAQVGADPTGTAASAVSAHNSSETAHSDIRTALAGKETAGAAAAVQSNLDGHTGNTTVHITAAERTKWNGKQDKLTGAQGQIVGFDPDGKAVAQDKPTYAASEVGAIPTTEKGASNGVATLGTDGKVPTGQLPAMNYAPSTHASQHATGGSDPITPASIGAAAASHNQAASTITAGTFAATDVKAMNGTDYTTARVRNIKASTTDLTAGSSALANGDIYLVYE